MSTIHDPNQNGQGMQGTPLPRMERLRKLRVWRAEYGVTWVEMGRHMTALKGEPVTGSAVQKSLEGERMPVDNHAALLRAYPHLPAELLPRPEDTNRTHPLFGRSEARMETRAEA